MSQVNEERKLELSSWAWISRARRQGRPTHNHQTVFAAAAAAATTTGGER